MRFEPVLKKILVATDGTPASLVAQELAAFLARVFMSKVTVIHVISNELTSLEYEYAALMSGGISMPRGGTDRSTEPPSPDLIEAYNEMEDSFYRKGEKILSESVVFFKGQGVKADEKLVKYADSAEAIMKQAREGVYDLIVMGQREDEGEEPHLGSTAEKVTRHSETPVLIAKSGNKISKMLVPFEGSQNAEKALEYAAYLSKKIGAQMTLLYVHQSELIRLRAQAAKEVENRVLSIASEILESNHYGTIVESGDPAKIIIQTAKKGEYDLIVMGTKGGSAVARFLLGSVSEHVIHYTDRSVLLVR
jgi:nucleotide-binding universal stress UspA family protein